MHNRFVTGRQFLVFVVFGLICRSDCAQGMTPLSPLNAWNSRLHLFYEASEEGGDQHVDVDNVTPRKILENILKAIKLGNRPIYYDEFRDIFGNNMQVLQNWDDGKLYGYGSGQIGFAFSFREHTAIDYKGRDMYSVNIYALLRPHDEPGHPCLHADEVGKILSEYGWEQTTKRSFTGEGSRREDIFDQFMLSSKGGFLRMSHYDDTREDGDDAACVNKMIFDVYK